MIKKPKKCRICKKEFKPAMPLQVVCGFKCAVVSAKKKTEREYKAVTREKKNKLKTKAKWLAEAQAACNAYIRERDKNEPCISCGTTNQNIQYAAGHYKTRGASPELRFHPMNINKQCNSYCNNHLSGNLEKYRVNLIKKIGLKNVEWLEGKQELQKLTIDDVKEIKAYYKEQLKIIKTG